MFHGHPHAGGLGGLCSIDPQAISLRVPPVGQSGGHKNKNKWDPKEGLSRNKGYQLAGGHLITQQLGNPVSMNPMPYTIREE